MTEQKQVNEILTGFVKQLETISISGRGMNFSVKPDYNTKDQLFKIITNSRFRRTALDEESKNDLIKKISDAVDLNLPIEFSIPFGCYKSHLMPTYPEADWSEVFNLRYMIDYLMPISKLYKPGAILSYSYTQLANDTNNVPKSLHQAYIKSFLKLVDYFLRQCPENIMVRVQEINDLYDKEQDWKDELGGLYQRNKNNWETLYSQNVRNKKEESARHNFIIKGERDLSGLTEEELNKEYVNAAMMVDAIESLSKRRFFNKLSHRIQIGTLKGSKAMHLGSCESSTVLFWVGLGVVEIRKNRVISRILSYTQMKSSESKIKSFTIENKLGTFSDNFKNLPFISE